MHLIFAPPKELIPLTQKGGAKFFIYSTGSHGRETDPPSCHIHRAASLGTRMPELIPSRSKDAELALLGVSALTKHWRSSQRANLGHLELLRCRAAAPLERSSPTEPLSA
jgi:hypothetical protein